MRVWVCACVCVRYIRVGAYLCAGGLPSYVGVCAPPALSLCWCRAAEAAAHGGGPHAHPGGGEGSTGEQRGMLTAGCTSLWCEG